MKLFDGHGSHFGEIERKECQEQKELVDELHGFAAFRLAKPDVFSFSKIRWV